MATTDIAGVVQERMAFDAYGRRRNLDWTHPSQLEGPAPPGHEGRLHGHDSDDELPAVDMGGRMYDPILKRFYQPDSIVQNVAAVPAWNRYSYVFDNPLRFTDPTGHLTQFGDRGPGDSFGQWWTSANANAWSGLGWRRAGATTRTGVPGPRSTPA